MFHKETNPQQRNIKRNDDKGNLYVFFELRERDFSTKRGCFNKIFISHLEEPDRNPKKRERRQGLLTYF